MAANIKETPNVDIAQSEYLIFEQKTTKECQNAEILTSVGPKNTAASIEKIPNSDLLRSNHINFKRNEICFAKLTGYVPWPAQVRIRGQTFCSYYYQ